MSAKTTQQRKRNAQRKRSNQLMLREWPPNSPSGKELYYFDVASTITPSAAWTVYNGLCAIPSTAGVPDRQGLRVTPIAFEAHLMVRGDLNSGYSTGNFDCSVRVIFFQARYAAPIAADLLVSSSLINSPYNMAHIGQGAADATIKVLYDETFVIARAAQISYSAQIRVSVPDLLVKHMRFADYTATDPVNGGIYLAVFTDNTIPSRYGTVHAYTRLLYNDA